MPLTGTVHAIILGQLRREILSAFVAHVFVGLALGNNNAGTLLCRQMRFCSHIGPLDVISICQVYTYVQTATTANVNQSIGAHAYSHLYSATET